MIVFLTICYCVLLWILVKTKILKPTLMVKLSPALWVLLLLIGLFIPMMFWAPSGNIIVTQRITRITPQVSGRVIKIHVQPNEQVKKGAPLVTIDPTPYQDKVDALKAQLAAAKQDVPELKAAFGAASSTVAQAKAQRDVLGASLEAATSAVVQAKAQRDLAQTNLAIINQTRQLDVAAVSQLKYDQATQTFAEAEATVKTAQANEQNARAAYEIEAPATIQTALANEEKARLAYQSEIGGVNTTVVQLQAELAKAEWDLSETTIYAPTDGYVTDFTLTEGSAIAVAAGNAMINFLSDGEPAYIVAAIEEKNLRYVQPGQPAEMVLPLYPGKTLTGKVEEVVWVTGEGQIMPQAQIPTVASRVRTGGEFAVKIRPDPEWSTFRLPVGAGGEAAIYTDRGKPTHVIRQVMLRMTAWLNYLWQMPGQ